MNTLRRNFGYKFLSLLVAILLYWIASGQKNPPVKAEFYVQPQVMSLSADLVLKGPLQGTTVSVSGPAAAVEAYRALEPKAQVDLTAGKVGSDRYPVKYLMPNGFANALEVIGPPVTLVTLEQKKSVQYYVDPIFDDHPPAGYAYSPAKCTPAAVQVVGLTADVSRVWRVVANVDTSGTPGAISQDVELVAQDIKQQAIDSVQIVPNHVHVTLGLKKTPSTKTVLLSIKLNGTPDPRFEISGYSFVPNTVTISGAQEMLASQSSLVIPVDVDGLRASTTRSVTIQPPSGLRVVGGSATVKLRLDVKPIATASPAAPVKPSPPILATPTATTPVVSPTP